MYPIYLLLYRFLAPETLPIAMQNASLALLTILIPVTLFIFSLENKTLFEWDKIVILDEVVEAKNLLSSVALMFLPLFFWSDKPSILKLFLFLFFITGLIYLIKILFNVYHWIKAVEITETGSTSNFRDSLRNKYLDKIDNLPEKEKIWILTWHKKISNTIYERNLIKKFIINADALVKMKNYDLLHKYLQNFLTFIDNRALYDWEVYEDFFDNLLKWYFEIWADQSNQGVKYNINLLEVQIILSNLIQKFVLSALQKGPTYILFEKLKTRIKGQKLEDVETLFSQSICRVFFENITDSPENYTIWENYFPSEWKTTEVTFKDKSNVISKIWLNQFIQWAEERIRKPEKNYDKFLDEVTPEIFPSVEPILWSQILVLLMRPFTGDTQIRELVEIPPNFGFAGRVMASFFQPEDKPLARFDNEFKEQEQSALKLALLLFKEKFTKEKLARYIADLNLQQLKYGETTRKYTRCKYFINIFEQMVALQI